MPGAAPGSPGAKRELVGHKWFDDVHSQPQPLIGAVVRPEWRLRERRTIRAARLKA
jgi:hypothetical protein